MSAEPIDTDPVLEPRDLTPAELDQLEAANRPAPSTNGHRQARPAPTAARAMPEAPEAEEAFLGACLLNPDAIDAGIHEGIAGDHFRTPSHQLIYDAITTLHTNGDPVDAVTVADVLTRRDQLERTGGPSRLVALQGAPAAITSAGRYARTVIDAAHLRRLIAAAAEIAEIGYSRPDDTTAALQRAQDTVQALTAHTTAKTLHFDDVAGAMRGTIERVTPDHMIRTDGTALMYPGRLHWLMGEPGKGKTWVALHAAHQLLEVDVGHVIYLDWENSRDLIADRLNTLGADPDRVETQLRYTRSPTLDPTWIAALANSIQDGPNTLIVIDGAAPSIASGGWKEKDESDVLAWLDRIVWPLTATGAAVLVLDHVTKDRETRGLWPRGSGAKSGAVDGAAWLYRVRKPFSRLTAGHADLIQAKDREGVNGEDGTPVASFHATPQGPDKPTLFELRPPAATTSPDGAFRPTILMERLSRHIEAENRYNRRPTRTELVGGPRGETAQVKGKKAHLSQALEVLLDEGWVTVDTAGRSNLHTSERPYREADDAPPGGAGGTEDEEEF